MKKILIVQPSIPKYRVPFFNYLSKKYNVVIYSNKTDFLGVVSQKYCGNVVWGNGFLSFKNKILWHKGLPIFSMLNKNTIVVVNGNPRVLNYMLLLLLCKMKGIKTIWWGHGWSAGSCGILSSIRIKMMEIANCILVYTDYEKTKINKKKCFALNNGLNSSEIVNAINDSDFRHDFCAQTRMVFVGRLTKKSNLEFLINAMKYLPENIKLSVIGDGVLKETFINLADELKVSDRIVWHGAIYDEKLIASVMLKSDVFVYPGSVGLSLIHAYNYGLPSIIHNNREMHMPEYAAFIEGYNGLGYDEMDTDSFCRAVLSYSRLSNNEKRKLRDNAFNTVKTDYNIESMVLRFEDAINFIS
ncbi:glycosyltransferase family 4 protein [Escherichia albertii]|uniref:Predicted glycosyltransferase n=1 Tax=Escherichia albertii TaxID=208962 RepID=A0A5A4U7P5_ESCAL|nr:glycosyltransferase family 4 protein [Escherichia albertii]MCZ8687466.1 glycosyltransferase family 4 protein [Escherichia albertii]MCZ8733619.1 glycosyltransferase family 4 protein [Escherichia albertii]MCZ8858276.1 glycosyltransferase family 4 protein [Escherichia albertii]MCZ8885706.1 glycosyltransferase family 4 protein [Escherichia albertii]MCZ8894612.1 glycosyltransferase family 4 protein [Escherichia albertii]